MVWETLDSKLLWQSQWYNLRQDRLRTQDGHEFTYTIVDHPGARVVKIGQTAAHA